MKKLTSRIALFLWILCLMPLEAMAATALVPVGRVVGLELRNDCVSVAAFDPQLGTAAKAAGLQTGDEILSIDGQDISCAEDVHRAVERSDGMVQLRIRRENTHHELTMRPNITAEGPKLGIYLRQGVTGIGTVTWYDPETGEFGALGHGVNQGDGTLVNMTKGYVYPAEVISVRRGKVGTPGQLFGAVAAQEPAGQLRRNCEQGVFGDGSFEGAALPVAQNSEIRTGNATILSTVDKAGPREYSVEILKIYPQGNDGRNLLLKITDPALLEATGGIVQGMSGSPIIQDGKLVGAVTHVLVNDPTTGYGIFIENMLDAAA